MNLSDQDEILLLRAQVDYLLERLAESPALTERPVNWAALDAEQAGEQWQLLTEFTDWLRERYQLQESVPACWYAHGPMIEELSALRSAWVSAYLDPAASPADPAAWHDQLDRTRYRLRQWDRNGCADGTHRPDLDLPNDTDTRQRNQTIHDDLTRRTHEGDPR